MLRVEPQIKENFVAAGRVSLAFSHVLDHGNASRMAHQAAECAGSQDPLGFWAMHDRLFSRQGELWNATTDLFVTWAVELGLDGEAMRQCIDAPATIARVTELDQARRDRGIRIRPSFELNGRLLEGALAYNRFEQLFVELTQ